MSGGLRREGRQSCWVVALSLGAALVLSGGRVHAQFLNVRPEPRPALPAGETMVDEVLAVVDLESDERAPVFVLASEVDLALRFELTVRGAPSPLSTAVDVTVTRGILEQVMGEKLLVREAMRAGDPMPSDAALAAERARWIPRLAVVGGLGALLRAVSAEPGDFDAFLRRRLWAAAFLQRHIARSIEPTEVELRAAYDEERFGAFRAEGVSFAVARHEIREELMRQNYPRAVRAYLRSISSRARVRLFLGSGEEDG